MPKYWKYDLNEFVVINTKALNGIPSAVNKTGYIYEMIEEGRYDYRVYYDNAYFGVFKEEELDLLKIPFTHNEIVTVKRNGNIGNVLMADVVQEQVEVMYLDGSIRGSMEVVGFNDVEKIKIEVEEDEKGNFERIGHEIGKFTESKNKQYGSSVDATYDMMKVLMDRYTYNEDENKYLIPKELIKHILLQVRMMDKQNRVFNNPTGEGDSESPYRDLAGYSIIGVDMVEK